MNAFFCKTPLFRSALGSIRAHRKRTSLSLNSNCPLVFVLPLCPNVPCLSALMEHLSFVKYPVVPPEIVLPELDGKTDKMYRGGRICLTGTFRLCHVYLIGNRYLPEVLIPDHFYPLWSRNAIKFGIGHGTQSLTLAPILKVKLKSIFYLPAISARSWTRTVAVCRDTFSRRPTADMSNGIKDTFAIPIFCDF